jgi:prephenate dehydrogenase
LPRRSAARSRSRPPLQPNLGRIGVAGPGLIGGSVALRARALGLAVGGWDVDEGNLRQALACGALSTRAASLRELAAGSDILVLAAPLDATLAQLAELATLDRLPPLTIDVASVKAPVARAGRDLPGFVATHPIAGGERSGVSSASADLFEGKVWAYDAAAAPAQQATLAAFIGAMGATPLGIDPAEHDRIVALTSHLPQLVSIALGRQLEPSVDSAVALALCGTGIRSMLRLAGSSWTIWRAILAANAAPVAQEVREFAAILSGVATALESGAVDDLEGDFRAAARSVARLEANAANRGAVHSASNATTNDNDEG